MGTCLEWIQVLPLNEGPEQLPLHPPEEPHHNLAKNEPVIQLRNRVRFGSLLLLVPEAGPVRGINRRTPHKQKHNRNRDGGKREGECYLGGSVSEEESEEGEEAHHQKTVHRGAHKLQ